MYFREPKATALIFCRSVMQPWRAYLAKYPEVPLVIVIGDDTAEKLYEPQPKELEAYANEGGAPGVAGLRLLRSMTIDRMGAAPLTMVVYENARG